MDADKITYLEALLEVEGADGKMRDGVAELNWVIQHKSFQGVVDFKVYKAGGVFENKYVRFLQDRGLSALQIADLFKSNPTVFSMGTLDADKIAYLEALLEVEGADGKMRDGKVELNWILQNRSFSGIVSFKVSKTGEVFENKYVKFLQDRGLSVLQIADLFKNNPRAFSKGDLDTDKITYLEELLGVKGADDQVRDGEAELNWVIQHKSFAGIVSFKVVRSQEGFENRYVKFLQNRGFSPLQIADIFKSNPQAFSKGNLDASKIAYLERYLGKGNRETGKQKLDQIILKKGGFKALTRFDYNSDTQPANRVIDTLENSLHFSQDQVIQFMEEHFSELFVEKLIGETSEELLKRLTEKVSDICQKSLIK